MRTLLLLIMVASTMVRADSNPVTLSVKQTAAVDNKGKTGDTKTQTRSLDITMNNLGRAELKVTVNYWFFARDLKKGSEEIYKHGSRSATLPSNTPMMVQSDTITTTFTEEHVEIEKSKGGKGGGKGKNKSKATKVEASGDRITGYAVQVLVGKDLAAEFYSAPSLKQKLTGK